MKKHISFLFLTLLCLVSLSTCLFGNYWVGERYRETRTGLIGTNIIGIAGEPGEEPYIEIIYSTADEERLGCNKTASIMVSPPYVFQNDKVYMTYEYVEWEDNGGPLDYSLNLLRDFEEGGAEYLRIINHSPDKPVEFFVAEAPRTIYEPALPSWTPWWIRYRNAPVYFLLYPEEKPSANERIETDWIIYFEGDRIGDLIVTEPWTVENIASLYRAEYARSDEVKLSANWDREERMIDLVEGKVEGWESWLDNIFYGIIEAGEELHGNEKIWLLATGILFRDCFLWKVPLK